MRISYTVDAAPLEAYAIATSRSRVVLMKPFSTPPHTPHLLGVQNASGSKPETPRYTVAALVSLPSFTTAELHAWSDVTYLFPLHRRSN